MKPDTIVAVITCGRKVLFICRGPSVVEAGYWAPLSGKIEPGERQEAAVIREVKEEVGLSVRPLRKVWENISSSGDQTLHWWLAEYVEGALTLDPREASDARWVTVDEIDDLHPTFAGDRAFFQQVYTRL
ncbi:NUDIX hydrolase [Candidatus Entotheonella palauensis]|uniref:DNA mismatch repair protein MutT n=1 Tax=Candidatus Entotheonella gemina TaxID=1429439 RepID=W4LBB7_9BACT|nr:NUDIX domain-containing protein [Candidatus Entotheonella palauensis]ETW95272.1 MAG: DNA mismatch repair protein MutT [Candidatus Entotheonella gemina]